MITKSVTRETEIDDGQGQDHVIVIEAADIIDTIIAETETVTETEEIEEVIGHLDMKVADITEEVARGQGIGMKNEAVAVGIRETGNLVNLERLEKAIEKAKKLIRKHKHLHHNK